MIEVKDMSGVLMEEQYRRIGDNLRKYRLLKGLTQEELAEGLCSVSQLSKVENGKTALKRSLLKQMANRLGVTIERIEASDALLEEISETLQLARDAQTAGFDQKSLELVDRVIEQSRDFAYKELMIEGLLHKCRVLNKLSRLDEVIELVERALAEKIPLDAAHRMLFLIEIGTAHEMNGNKAAAHDYYYQADEVAEAGEGTLDTRLRVYFNLGRCHHSMRNHRTALRYVEKAERIATELSKHLWRIRSTYMKATFLGCVGETEQAERVFLGALKEAEDNSLLLDVGIINNNMGHMYQKVGELGQAAAHYQRAKQVYELLDARRYLSTTLVHLAELAMADDDLAQAVALTEQVFVITRTLESNTYTAEAKAWRLLGMVEQAKRNFDGCIEHLERSLALYDRHHAVIAAYEAAKETAEAMYAGGHPGALDMYRRAVEYNEKSLKLRR